MKTFYNWLENQEPDDIKQQIMKDDLPANLKELFRAVIRYNQQSNGNTLFRLMAKYDNIKLPMLDSHGLAKVSIPFQIRSLLRLLQAGKLPNSMFSAPLTSSSENAGSGAGIGTGGGSAYRDGAFIVVALPGKTLHDEIKYVIVDGSVADANFNKDGMTPTQFLQKELGQGKYIFIDGGEKNNQLDSFFSKMQQYNQKTNTPSQQPAPFNLRTIGIQPTEAEIKQFPDQNKIGIRNRKKGSPGYGSMHYYDKSNPQFQQFIDELKASFGL
jgi:hypothetical protein